MQWNPTEQAFQAGRALRTLPATTGRAAGAATARHDPGFSSHAENDFTALEQAIAADTAGRAALAEGGD